MTDDRNTQRAVTDASDPEQVNRAQETEQASEYDLDFILSDARGRRWVYRLVFGDCHILNTSFTDSAEHTAFNEGARAIGAGLLTQLLQRPAAFAQVMAENHNAD